MKSDGRDAVSRRRFVRDAAVAASSIGVARAASAACADVKIGLHSITYGGVWYR